MIQAHKTQNNKVTKDSSQYQNSKIIVVLVVVVLRHKIFGFLS
jgi:hypothetical protein